jgi:hypothetical protein
MFVFYSNRLGCLGSILISVVLTVVLILALGGAAGEARSKWVGGPRTSA